MKKHPGPPGPGCSLSYFHENRPTTASMVASLCFWLMMSWLLFRLSQEDMMLSDISLTACLSCWDWVTLASLWLMATEVNSLV